MMYDRFGIAVTVATAIGAMLPVVPAPPRPAAAPEVFLMDGPAMERLRSFAARDPHMAAAMAELRSEADRVLDAGPFSVTDKTSTPPSGDKHDYMSVAPYWWPNPDTPDGLPYVARDGRVNPERNGPAFDAERRDQILRTAGLLTLAWYYTRHEPYGRRAALLLRTWFLDPATRMNPHLEYAQAVPGRTDGRSYGIIETAEWVYLVDIAGLLEGSEHWTPEDQQGMRRWFAAYLDWLQSSEHGQAEQRARNNHGTWYDAQIVAYSLFTGQPELARRQLHDWTLERMAAHFAEDGSQPLELRRTRSWHYSLYNLRAFFILARLAEHVDVDLWNHPADTTPVLRHALDFLLPAAVEGTPWPYQEIGGIRSGDLGGEVLPLAIRAWGAPAYRDAYRRIDQDGRSLLGRLLFPGVMLAPETPGAERRD